MKTYPYEQFVFEDFGYDESESRAWFQYSFDGTLKFEESITLQRPSEGYDEAVLERVLQLAFYLVGTSYYKAFPVADVHFAKGGPNTKQAEFLQTVYTHGLSQYLFENGLQVADIAQFEGSGPALEPLPYAGQGLHVLQSGGKDSLLLATVLNETNRDYSVGYISSADSHPAVIDELGHPLRTIQRVIAKDSLIRAKEEGGLNGHVPVTYIVLAYSMIDAVLQNQNTVLAAIGAEGAEPHEFVDDLPVNHQWSKSWEAEQLLAEYVAEHISADLRVGSPLRGLSELRIAESFAEHAWQKYGHSFSSCNLGNYKQGADNQALVWCGECPKCANSYLLFAPFVEPAELRGLFGSVDLFARKELHETFKGLLGIDGVMKPFECVGEVGELRLAYHMARERYQGVYELPFAVPKSTFDYKKILATQAWAQELVAPVY